VAQFFINTLRYFYSYVYGVSIPNVFSPALEYGPNFQTASCVVRRTKVTHQMTPVSVTRIQFNWCHSHHKNWSIRHVVIIDCRKLKSNFRYMIRYDMIYLTAIGLTPGRSSTVHISTQYKECRERNITNNKKLNIHNNKKID
jgi:hypothetical protein